MNESSISEPHVLPASGSPSNGALSRVFMGPHGIRAGWSALLFAVIFAVLLILVSLSHLISSDSKGPVPLRAALLQESCLALMVAAATLVMARIEKRSILSYGYTGQHRLILC